MNALEGVYSHIEDIYLKVLIEVRNQIGLDMRPTRGLSSFEEQNAIYQQGRTTPGKIVTYAQAGDSWHNYGMAIDSCFRGQDPYLETTFNGAAKWKKYGDIVAKYGFTWGGNFKNPDCPHIQMTFGLELSVVKSLYLQGGIDAVWKQIDTVLGGQKNG